MFAALSEFERSIIRERAAEGIAIAKAKGKKLGRREIKVDDDKLISLSSETLTEGENA
ncbi:MAG: recombinase family protein [Lachnospiraceae bacterium]|nr:recombinase family protein [Erysipelotrichaceae bacterium]MBR2546556.1 recombinase family protein [Erysipelotrichaceae bacterium]MBR4341962.1 recombinase family protein [Lachnospiraceae bacterium]